MTLSIAIDALPTDDAAALARPLQSAVWQSATVVAAAMLIAVLHWHNDGLWFQGDSPRHAINGFFHWDLLTALPVDPRVFTLSYYARYPVIVPLVYPPLFYVLEGFAFRTVAPSPYVAKAIVLMFAVMIGLYTTLWARRWIAPFAGWAGPCLVLMPGLVRYSNAVLLNVPATALGFAALYHLRMWQDTESVGHRRLFSALAVASVLTYYPAAIIVPVGFVWLLTVDRGPRSLSVWLLPAAGLLLLAVAGTVMPVHLARHAPSIGRLFTAANWTFYLGGVSSLTGLVWLVLAMTGLACAFVSGRRRQETLRLALTCGTVLACLVLLPAFSDRYALVLAPITILGAFLGIVTGLENVRRRRTQAATAALVAAMVLTGWSAVNATVPVVSGIEQVATYLRTNAAHDAVLYSGLYDGVFGFYVRAGDPGFERRLVLSNKLLYQYKQEADFTWVETARVESPSDVVSLIQGHSGCQWVAVEVGPEPMLPASERYLRRALEGPEFERVRSFPTTAGSVIRIDLYRVRQRVDPVAAVDLKFSSFSDRIYQAVEPIKGPPVDGRP